jgi:hypothetical protein
MHKSTLLSFGILLGLAACAPQMPTTMSEDTLASDANFQKLPEARCMVGAGHTADSSFRYQQERLGIDPATGVGNATQDRFGMVGMAATPAGQPVVSTDMFDRSLVDQMSESELWGQVVRDGDAQFRLSSTILSQQVDASAATVSAHYAMTDDYPSLRTVWQTDVTTTITPVNDPTTALQRAMRDNIAVMIRRLAVLAGICAG